MRFIEWFLSLLCAINCLGVALLFAGEQPGSFWPAPGIYLIEIAILGVFGLSSQSLNLPEKHPSGSAVPWLIAGALLAFVILGGFSIGPYLIPATVGFWVAGAISDHRHGRSVGNHIVLSFLAIVAQGTIILALIPIIQS
jgi:hypothetical protein